MGRFGRWAPFAVGIVVSVGLSAGAYRLADHAWNQVVDYRGPYAGAELPASRGTTATASRVVLVIVDGMRTDVSRRMPALERLADRGADLTVTAGQPSLSYPCWTTLLSGAPQRFSGVPTNWYDQPVKVETLFDVAFDQSRTVVVSAPTDFEKLYRVKRSPHVYLRSTDTDAYLSADFVDHAISLAEQARPDLVVVHLPDIDEAGHAHGGASPEYRAMARRVDGDLARLVTALEDSRTVFVVAADHGHIDTGGHGGPEPVVTRVRAVFAGGDVALAQTSASQADVAPTLARIAGLAAPRHSIGVALPLAGASRAGARDPYEEQRAAALAADTYLTVPGSGDPSEPDGGLGAATAERESAERVARFWPALGLALGAIAVLVVIGLLSWRALVAALAGTAGYYALYDGLYFLVHRHTWSLSTFNSEDLVKPFMNGRMLEAALAGLFAALVAADIYLVTRRPPRRPQGEYLAGWLSLGTATVLAIQATLALQIAWYLWWWGADVTWLIPDLKWGFKFDLDLIQATALAAAALLAPVVTYLVGRYHPIRDTPGRAGS